MTQVDLLHFFHQASEAPGAIDELRRLVLDLAVCGQLTTRDVADFTEFRGTQAAAPDGVPHGWRTLKLREALREIQTGPFGSSLHQSDYVVGGTPVVNPASIQPPRIVPLPSMAVGPETLERLSTFRLMGGDIVVARRGEMGRCAVVTSVETGWLCGTGSLVLRPRNWLNSEYLALLIGTPRARTYLSGAAVGTTMQNLNQRVLLEFEFSLPPLVEQSCIVAKVDELMKLLDRLESSQTRVSELKRRLLEALVHGALERNTGSLGH